MKRSPLLNSKYYELDEDGYRRGIVGAWAKEKHLLLQQYVGATWAARRNFVGPKDAGATYIDLFCGPARARVDGTNEVIDGSPLVAWRQSAPNHVPFTAVHIADSHPQLVEAAEARLKVAGAPVASEVGQAVETVDRIITKLDQHALHFAFLDPNGLKPLPFEVLQKLARLRRMDMLIHVSVQGLQRNLGKWAGTTTAALDDFAPEWRKVVDPRHIDANSRSRVFEHWRGLLQTLGMRVSDAVQLVRGDENQRLYWLAFAAHHPLPVGLWEKISQSKQRNLGF
jgi:three-Cys-motif partner protein